MRLEFFIASKYLKTKKENLFISTMTVISVIMVILFVGVPILTSSVTNGFQKNIIDKVYTFDFHVRIEDPNNSFVNWKPLIKKLKKNKYVKNTHYYFQEKALIKRFGQNFVSNLRGVRPEDINKNIFGKNFRRLDGELKLNNENSVILAESLASNLFVRPGDTVTIAVVDASSSSSPFNTINLKVAGIFSAGYARYDTFLAYTSITAMRKLTRSNPKLISTIGIYLKNKKYIKKFISELKNDSSFKHYKIINSGANDIFREFRKEKKLISLILYVAILLSFLNIYITLNVIVVERKKDIGILKSYGIKSKTIQRVFIFEGILIGVLGASLGIILGLFLTVNIQDISQFIEYVINSLNKVWSYALGLPEPASFEIMPKEKFYLTTLPYEINLFDVFLQSTGAILAAIFAAYFPAKRAAKKRPVEVLRYE